MDNQIKLIEGGVFQDSRGVLKFINDFDMKDIRRVYIIEPIDTEYIRAWQGHKIEYKYFFATQGSFTIGLVRIDDWFAPSKSIVPTFYTLDADKPKVLCVPGGYANGIKSNLKESQLMVFSSCNIEDARDDEYRFELNYWNFARL